MEKEYEATLYLNDAVYDAQHNCLNEHASYEAPDYPHSLTAASRADALRLLQKMVKGELDYWENLADENPEYVPSDASPHADYWQNEVEGFIRLGGDEEGAATAIGRSRSIVLDAEDEA